MNDFRSSTAILWKIWPKCWIL